jgi:hypothetical protein
MNLKKTQDAILWTEFNCFRPQFGSGKLESVNMQWYRSYREMPHILMPCSGVAFFLFFS